MSCHRQWDKRKNKISSPSFLIPASLLSIALFLLLLRLVLVDLLNGRAFLVSGSTAGTAGTGEATRGTTGSATLSTVELL